MRGLALGDLGPDRAGGAGEGGEEFEGGGEVVHQFSYMGLNRINNLTLISMPTSDPGVHQ